MTTASCSTRETLRAPNDGLQDLALHESIACDALVYAMTSPAREAERALSPAALLRKL